MSYDDSVESFLYWLKHPNVYRKTQWRYIQTHSMYKEKRRVYRKLKYYK